MFTGLLVITASLFGGISAPPNSYVRWSADYKRALVMIAPHAASDQGYLFTWGKLGWLRIRDVVPVSGIYECGQLGPQVTYTWFSRDHEILFTPDLKYVVRYNRFAMNPRVPWAVQIYAGASLVREFLGPELIQGPKIFLPLSTWDWYIRWHERLVIDSDALSIRIYTACRFLPIYGSLKNPGDIWTINLRTGEVLEEEHPFVLSYRLTLVILGLLPLLASIGFIYLVRRRRSRPL